jgi:Dolichyl-phosphate-mannose-protein mannosyltransferase
MAIEPAASRSRTYLLVAVTLATLLAIWLRTYGVTTQVVIDDEWHAIHKLVSASYENIFRTFGLADHSIPLTIFYKAMAQTVGLTEGRMRALQIVCGIVVVPVSVWLAWRATDDAPAAALFAFLMSAAPFLVMWSRFARPYAITLLLIVLCVAAIWRWRTERSRRLAACAAITAALAAWLHPICGMYPAIACLFVFFEDICVSSDVRPRPSSRSLALGAAVAGAMLLLLAAPLLMDRGALADKAGGDQPDFETYERMLAIFWGGVPTPVVALACVLAAWGVVRLYRRDPRLAAYLVALGAVPAGVLTLTGALWMHEGQTFARYQLPLQPLLLFFGSIGAMSVVRAAAGVRAESAAWIACALLSAAYLWATPAIAQVAQLGTWYAHMDYHWDYRYRWLVAKRDDPKYAPPEFYRKLALMAPGSAPIIEAPFSHEAPHNLFDIYATYHRQPETFGMIHDLCLGGSRSGEPPHDPRFRFRKFIFLDDVSAVRQSGARYLLLHREQLHGRPFHEAERCLDKLTRLYGAPAEIDARLAVFDLKPAEPRRSDARLDRP